jgi:cyclophilin family peptidyl-prolyl cis-trans isomerase
MKNFTKICLLSVCLACAYSAGAQTELTFYTTKGIFKAVLTDTLTPRTVDSFIARVSKKFYDGLIFHRVIDGFVVQGGDPLGTGTGGPGYYTPDEIVPSLKNVMASLAMANAGPGTNTNGSQFYFNLVNNTSLDGKYTVLGMVTTNFTVVQNIGHVPVDPTNNKPLTNVTMDSVRITKYPLAAANIAGVAAPLIYPNPCRGVFNIDLPGIDTRVSITDMLGHTVYHTNTRGALTVDLRTQAAGLYIIHMENTNGTAQSKLVVQ